jgi:hypothetical protein
MEAPDSLPASATIVFRTEMVYHTIAEIRELTAGMTGSERTAADVLIRMIETYDPTTQATVMVGFAKRNPSVKMRLDQPFLVEDAS